MKRNENPEAMKLCLANETERIRGEVGGDRSDVQQWFCSHEAGSGTTVSRSPSPVARSDVKGRKRAWAWTTLDGRAQMPGRAHLTTLAAAASTSQESVKVRSGRAYAAAGQKGRLREAVSK